MKIRTLDLATMSTGIGFEKTDQTRLFETASRIFETDGMSIFAIKRCSDMIAVMAEVLLPGWPTPEEANRALDNGWLDKLVKRTLEKFGDEVEFPTHAAFLTRDGRRVPKWPKGPYYVVQHPVAAWTIQDRESGGGTCIASQYGNSGLECAALLAQAPAMFDALKDLISWRGDLNTMPPEIRGAWLRADAVMQAAMFVPAKRVEAPA